MENTIEEVSMNSTPSTPSTVSLVDELIKYFNSLSCGTGDDTVNLNHSDSKTENCDDGKCLVNLKSTTDKNLEINQYDLSTLLANHRVVDCPVENLISSSTSESNINFKTFPTNSTPLKSHSILNQVGVSPQKVSIYEEGNHEMLWINKTRHVGNELYIPGPSFARKVTGKEPEPKEMTSENQSEVKELIQDQLQLGDELQEEEYYATDDSFTLAKKYLPSNLFSSINFINKLFNESSNDYYRVQDQSNTTQGPVQTLKSPHELSGATILHQKSDISHQKSDTTVSRLGMPIADWLYDDCLVPVQKAMFMKSEPNFLHATHAPTYNINKLMTIEQRKKHSIRKFFHEWSTSKPDTDNVVFENKVFSPGSHRPTIVDIPGIYQVESDESEIKESTFATRIQTFNSTRPGLFRPSSGSVSSTSSKLSISCLKSNPLPSIPTQKHIKSRFFKHFSLKRKT